MRESDKLIHFLNGFKTNAKGNHSRLWAGQILTVFKTPEGWKWSVATPAGQASYAPRTWPTCQAALAALARRFCVG